MIACAESLNTWLQASEQMLPTLLILLVFTSINMGISIGVLLLYIFSVRHMTKQEKKYPAESELADMLESMRNDLASMKEALSKVNIEPLLDRLSSVESRITVLESRTTVLERKLSKPPEVPPVARVPVKKPVETAVPSLSKLSDISLAFPDIKYAGIITSQGYIVESYGICSEEPAKLLEIIRTYSTNSASIVKGNSRIEIFHLGEVKDLSNYGILEFVNGSEVSEEVVERARKAISRYFTSAIASK
uniref:Uncharacterized protein n=1 Tax=Thermofilum pendens TaxID=2269 RepID=A0A7C3WTQ2_THEPE